MKFNFRVHGLYASMAKGMRIGSVASLRCQSRLVKVSQWPSTSGYLQQCGFYSSIPQKDTSLLKGDRMKTLYALIYHPIPKWGISCYSLYNFDIPANPEITEFPYVTEMAQIEDPIPVSPILFFPRTVFPWYAPMSFVELNSMLYFLGGDFTDYDDDDFNKYSAKVYVFDPTAVSMSDEPLDAGDNFVLRQVTSMVTGKPNLKAFIFNQKIYAMGSSKSMMPEIYNYFEVYNPNTDQWTKLSNPPWNNSLLVRHVVLFGKLYAFVKTNYDKFMNLVYGFRVFVFDLVKEVWITSFEYPEDCILQGNPYPHCYALVDQTLYECPCHGANVVTAHGPLPVEESSNMDDETLLSTLFDRRVGISPDLGFNFYEHHTPAQYSTASLLHFANKRICHVLSGHHGGVINDREVCDRKTRYFSINVFEPHIDQTYSRADWPLPAAKATCVYSSNFVSRTSWSTGGDLVGTCFISHSNDYLRSCMEDIGGVKEREFFVVSCSEEDLRTILGEQNDDLASGGTSDLQVQLTPSVVQLDPANVKAKYLFVMPTPALLRFLQRGEHMLQVVQQKMEQIVPKMIAELQAITRPP